jgi:hypothetical protein
MSQKRPSDREVKEKKYPKRRVVWLEKTLDARDTLILKLEEAGYTLIQISAYGTDNNCGCYGLFERKRTIKKTVNKNKQK